MSRTVALGAVIGFAVTILVMAIWERSASGPSTGPVSVDAGPVQALPLQVQFQIGRPLDIRPGPGPLAEVPMNVDRAAIKVPRAVGARQDAGP